MLGESGHFLRSTTSSEFTNGEESALTIAGSYGALESTSSSIGLKNAKGRSGYVGSKLA